MVLIIEENSQDQCPFKDNVWLYRSSQAKFRLPLGPHDPQRVRAFVIFTRW
jgi:hypothetical protein